MMLMFISASTVLWIYIILLVAGGLMGFLKANSKASLIASVSFAAILVLCNVGIVFQPNVADFALAFLLVFFGIRLAKSKKFMPNGMMVVLTLLTLILRHVRI
ncbi:MAG TPA: TMEM14 family protein [Verrucomicrobiae bacterium]|nr:TMEM14 family protein [Verrucomicrobiae bacterium]